MAQTTNFMFQLDDWELCLCPFQYGGSLIVLFVFFLRLKIQLRKFNHQKGIELFKVFQGKMIHLSNVLMNRYAYMRGLNNNHNQKPVKNARVIPYENKTIPKPDKRKADKHPWDIAQEIILAQKQAALAIKWSIIPLETLIDEQFLSVLHAVEEITDTTPLREVAKQLPKQIYGIVQSQEQITRIPPELTDQLIFDLSKMYYYSVIESLFKLIKSIQQGQRTALVSLAKIVQDQRDEIEKYKALSKLPKELKHLHREMERLKKHVNTHLERTDKKTSVISLTISEVRSQLYRLEATVEGNFDHIPEPDTPT